MLSPDLGCIIALMGELVNFGRPEFSCMNAIVKEQVNLAECAVLGLRKAEPAPDIAEKVGAGVEEAGFGAPVPGGRRNHARGDRI